MAVTKVGDQVLDLVIPYIRNRNSVSLVSRKSYEIDGITRKRLTVHVHYYPNPASLSKRFPFIESLTLKGPPPDFNVTDSYVFRIAPWIEQLALEFRCLKELYIRGLAVHDEDLEKLARTRGKDLRSLKIIKCGGYSTDGLMHVSKYCSQLRSLSLEHSRLIGGDYDGICLHQLALNNTVLERLHVRNWYPYNAEDLTLLAKNCCNSLISLKIGMCDLSKLGDAFRYADRLEQFAGDIWNRENDLVGFRFPPNIRSLSRMVFTGTQHLSVLPLLNQIRKLKLVSIFDSDEERNCLLLKRCPNLEVLYTKDVCGDRGLQLLGRFCKKLRKFSSQSLVTHVGMIALAKGCTNLEFLDVSSNNISNLALKCVGTHLKNLRDFRIRLGKEDGIAILPLDYGVRAMLMGCRKLKRLEIYFWYGGLTDVGLEYIGRYGVNLRSLSLDCVGIASAGLVKLSQGCKHLRKLKLFGYPFSEQVTSSVFNIRSLRYIWSDSSDRARTALALTRPDFQV